MDLALKGRKAIVTGASKGIGFAIAKLFADEGMDVALCARTSADVERAVAQLRTRGVNAIGDSIDVTKPDEYGAWINSTAPCAAVKRRYLTSSSRPKRPGTR